LAERNLLNDGVWRQMAQWMPLERGYIARSEPLGDVA